ncbi:class E sortase [Actinomadura fulvescens]|uniref:Sortase n=1 Tax=Actinomadura fulvescens TaxID=46160 RepID=A0ABN3QLB8_9ACTN
MNHRLSLCFLGTLFLTALNPQQAAGADRPRRVAPIIATIVIPKIGLKATVREGVARTTLRHAVGHYPGTAGPGQPGNTALLGHRTTGLALFRSLDHLTKGDTVILKTKSHLFRYLVRGKRVITPRRTSVLRPVPFRAGRTPEGGFVSLITCHPKGSNAKRLVVVGKLVSERPLRPHAGQTG